jgi:hypothetical protein
MGYRCGQGQPNGVEWVEWPSSVVGHASDKRTYPVFVQKHVLERLHGRNARVAHGEEAEVILQFFLWYSLRRPRIHPMSRGDGSFLVEYYLMEYKIGYLVARTADDCILVDTFLFLTMNQTPEGDLLWKELRLSREDKDRLGLDDLWTFLNTDLVQDNDLVNVFTRLGCGHLFQLSQFLQISEFNPGYASDIRKYLRIRI